MARSRRQPETATISSVTHDGRGIADTSGKKVFVAGALSGEEVRFVRRKSRRNFDEAELLEVITASPERVEAKCAVFGRCGGCALQHVSSAQQRAIKSDTLRDNLERIGRIEPGRWLQPITGPEWNYRRRARLAVKDVSAKGRVLVGFRERHAPFITDMHRCEVLAAPVDDLIDPLSDLVGKLSIRSRIPQIEVAVADNATALVFRVLDAPTADDLEALQIGVAGSAHHDAARREVLQDAAAATPDVEQPAAVEVRHDPTQGVASRFSFSSIRSVRVGPNASWSTYSPDCAPTESTPR